MNTTIDNSEQKFADQATITALVRGLIDDAQKDFVVDRRREHRFPLSVPLTVTPVGNAIQPSEEFVAVTRDISTRGISFFQIDPVDDHYVSIRFGESAVKVVIEVLRCRKIGPLWEIAGKFLTSHQK